MNVAYLSIGGNLGDRRENLRKALFSIHDEKEITLTKVSSFYETAPWGKSDQPLFLNAAAKVLTSLSPKDLLATLKTIEQKLGRVRKEHWGARTIDIDIIHYERVSLKDDELNLPHPYFDKRRFVLTPLCEIEPKLVINTTDIKTYLEKCEDNLPVVKTTGSPKDFKMILIAAVDKNNGIGYDNKLLYKIKSDLEYFYRLTLNNIVIFGKKTFKDMGALKGRIVIVMSRTENFAGENIYTVKSPAELFLLLDKLPKRKVFAAGGQEIYKLLMPYAEKACVTEILDEKTADRFLPPLHDFTLIKMLFSEEKGIRFAFAEYLR